MADSWEGIAKTTIADHIRDNVPLKMRRRILPAMMDMAGRITFNHSGDYMDWRIAKTRADLIPYDELTNITFARLSRHEVPKLDWFGYVMTESYSHLDYLKNRAEPAIVKAVSEKVTTLFDDWADRFHSQMYIDGNATGNANRIHGVNTLFGTPGAAPSGNAKILTPAATYAGLSTAPGVEGSWDTSGGNSIWPNGSGDDVYEYWSPVIIDYTSTDFGVGATWKSNGIQAMRYAITCRERHDMEDGKNVFFMLDRDLLRELKDEQQLKEQITVQRDGQASNLVNLGFKAMNLDGYDIVSEYGVPATAGSDTRGGYLLDTNAMEFRCMESEMVMSEGPTFKMEQQAYLILLWTYLQMRFISPCYQTQLRDAA